ncbi:SDC3 protein, partial [Ptilorrhoa leucosticta]|nr:SDC3 protein [Ptilorrhoa leucosticta]
AQRWRNENYERPVDLEGSGDDDPFGDDELDDVYSGSGSGYFEPELGLDTAVSVTTDTPLTLPTTAAVLPVTAAQPVATPLEPSPTPPATTPGQATGAILIARTTEAPAVPSWKATTTTSTAASESPTTAATTSTAATTTTSTTSSTTTEATTTTSSTTVAAAEPTTTTRRFLPPLATKAATARATTLETPTTPVPETSTPTEAATSRPVPSSTAKPRALPKPSTSRTAEPPEKSTALPPAAATLPPTEAPQVGGRSPSRLRGVLGSDVPPVLVPPAPSPSPERPSQAGGSGATSHGDTVTFLGVWCHSSGFGVIPRGLVSLPSSQPRPGVPNPPQLRLDGAFPAPVIVGGVVGALFAAFLVMLLIYRMKKKDEGSYTLEEPKQANVTYQKPDKQEEFYA